MEKAGERNKFGGFIQLGSSGLPQMLSHSPSSQAKGKKIRGQGYHSTIIMMGKTDSVSGD